MSEKGLGRVRTALAMSPLAAGPSGVSGHDRGDQRLDPDDVHYPGQIIDENREGHLGDRRSALFFQLVRDEAAASRPIFLSFSLKRPSRDVLPGAETTRLSSVQISRKKRFTGRSSLDAAAHVLYPSR
jgi:hypothetical protein